MSETITAKKNESTYSLTANMFIAFIITFAAGTICFEKYMPEAFISIYRMILIILCFLTWFALSFISGKKRKWQFAIYSALFWLVPQLIIYLANDGSEMFRKSITMYLLSEFFAIMPNSIMENVGKIIKVGIIPFAFITVLLCTFCFLGGYLTSNKDTEK